MTRRRAVESSSSWSFVDRAGLAFAWTVGLLFCAICGAIVIYVLVQGARYLRPELLWTNPKAGDTQSQTGGFLDPMVGTVLVTTVAMLLATPVGVGVAVAPRLPAGGFAAFVGSFAAAAGKPRLSITIAHGRFSLAGLCHGFRTMAIWALSGPINNPGWLTLPSRFRHKRARPGARHRRPVLTSSMALFPSFRRIGLRCC